MTTIVTRAGKGSALTHNEMDANFTNLNDEKLEKFDDNTSITTYAGPYQFSLGSPATNRHEFFAVTDGGFAAGAHTLKVQFDLETSGYFAAAQGTNPGTHLAVVLHQDPALAGTSVRGNGILIGQCRNGVNEGTPYAFNSAMIETWMGGTASTEDNRVIPGTEVPPAYTFTDGVPYRFVISSTVDDLDNKWIRFLVYRQNSAIHPEGAWDLMWDSGHHLDFNEWADFSKVGVMFASVFEPSGTWTVDISDVSIVWGPAESIAPANRHYRFGTSGVTGAFPTYASPGDTGDYTFNMTGWDNANIKDFASDGWNWNNILDIGDIKAGLQSSGMTATNADAVEIWVARPLYCMVAKILWHMRQRGW
jgi:hypothetical protein